MIELGPFMFMKPEMFWLLAMAPFLIVILIIRGRMMKEKLSALSFPDRNKKSRRIFSVLVASGFILMATGFSQPQMKSYQKMPDREKINLGFLVDVSVSMRAEDIKPSRLIKTLQIMREFINNLPFGYKIGVGVFAGDYSEALGLTSDYGSVLLNLYLIDHHLVSAQGTDFYSAILNGLELFDDENAKNRILILISDGEKDAEDNASLSESFDEAKKRGVKIYTIGVGSLEPTPVLDPGSADGYLRFMDKIVQTKLDPETLKIIASSTGGKYYHFMKADDLINALSDIISKESGEFIKVETYKDIQKYFFLGALAMFFAGEMLKKKIFRKI